MAKKSRYIGYVQIVQTATGKAAVPAKEGTSLRSKIAQMKEKTKRTGAGTGDFNEKGEE